MSTLKLNLKFTQTLEISEKGRAFILDTFKLALENPNDEGFPEGYRNAISKLPSDASEDLILSTLVGEVTACMIHTEIPASNPPADLGLWTTRISGVEYAEPNPPLPPPEGVQPQVIEVSRQHG